MFGGRVELEVNEGTETMGLLIPEFALPAVVVTMTEGGAMTRVTVGV